MNKKNQKTTLVPENDNPEIELLKKIKKTADILIVLFQIIILTKKFMRPKAKIMQILEK